jgi:hypothetical protein
MVNKFKLVNTTLAFTFPTCGILMFDTLHLFFTAVMKKGGQAGFQVDFVKARDLCLKAAEQPPFFKFPNGKLMANVGVAEAENFIGVSYRHGMGVDVVRHLFIS